MSQIDVYIALKEIAAKDPDWHNSSYIREYLKQKGFSNGVIKGVYADLISLSARNEIQMKGIGWIDHYKVFRYVKDE